MKVTVTHLKAPWPKGTAPGHVVELAGCDAVPGWALGKCVPAADDADAVSVWRHPGSHVELVVNPADAEADARAAEGLAAAEAQHQAEVAAAAEREAAKGSKGKAKG